MRDDRSPEALRRHYEVERELAARLRSASPSERRRLYGELYDELFRAVPDHPQHQWKADPVARARRRAPSRDRVVVPAGGWRLR